MVAQAVKNTASLCNGGMPLQIGLSPHLTPSDPGTRGTLTSPRELIGQHAALLLNGASLQVEHRLFNCRVLLPEHSENKGAEHLHVTNNVPNLQSMPHQLPL